MPIRRGGGTGGSGSTPTPNVLFDNPADPASTTANAFVMMGLAERFTPRATTPPTLGLIEVTISGVLENASVTAGQQAQVKIAYGTGASPSNGHAATGTVVGKPQFCESLITQVATIVPFSITVQISGLTRGTQIWIDLQLHSPSATASAVLYNLNVAVREIP